MLHGYPFLQWVVSLIFILCIDVKFTFLEGSRKNSVCQCMQAGLHREHARSSQFVFLLAVCVSNLFSVSASQMFCDICIVNTVEANSACLFMLMHYIHAQSPRARKHKSLVSRPKECLCVTVLAVQKLQTSKSEFFGPWVTFGSRKADQKLK